VKLEGKCAIVTGAAKGIGRAFAFGLAKEGASTVVADIDGEGAEKVSHQIKGSGSRSVSVRVDVSDEQSTIQMAEKAVAEFGRIDILVNNAGLWGGIRRVPFYELDVADWDLLMAVNVKGCWLCSKAVFPYMKNQDKGKIIHITSVVPFIGSPNMLHYVTSKAALIGLTRSMAKELGDYGINVNAIAPGLTTTEGTLSNVTVEDLERMAKARCLKRQELPEDLVGALIFLASHDSDFITGQILSVDGGASFH
jgi:3-oxoacyl-[acyl-carrier protein] reductase